MFTVKAYRRGQVTIDEAQRVVVNRDPDGLWASVMSIPKVGVWDFEYLYLGKDTSPPSDIPNKAEEPLYDEVIIENSQGRTTEIVRCANRPAQEANQ